MHNGADLAASLLDVCTGFDTLDVSTGTLGWHLFSFPYYTIMSRRKIALLIQDAGDWQRQVLRGVANYAHEHGGWDFYIEPRGTSEAPLIPPDWNGDGILCRLDGPEVAKAIRKLKVPAVNMSWLGKHSTAIPKVVSDEAACGTMAGEHFYRSVFAHMAYVRPIGRPGYGDLLGQSLPTLQNMPTFGTEAFLLKKMI